MIAIDRKSLLVETSGDELLSAVERALTAVGLTLALPGVDPKQTVRAFLEAGAKGAPSPFGDPADHLVAGLVAVSTTGKPKRLDVRPAPRRAVGPDLIAMVVGMEGRFFKLESAWLRVHEKGVARPVAPFRAPPAPPPSEAEARLLDRIRGEL